MKASHKGKYKKGGGIIAGGDFRKGGGDKEDQIAEHKKDGGKVHKAAGHKSKESAVKRARGGRIATVKSPLTGAMPTGLPGGGKGENRPDKSND
jgi:hypothetical protein